MQRKQELLKITEKLDEEQRLLIAPLLDIMMAEEKKLKELLMLPFVNCHPQNNAVQKRTAAAIEYSHMQSGYANKVRIISNLLRTVDASAADELMKKLEEFI